MRYRSPVPHRDGPRRSRWPGPRRRRRPAGSSPIRSACDRSIPNPLFVAAIPDLSDLAVDHVEDLHAADIDMGAILERHRTLVDDGDVFAIVTSHHEI